MNEKAQCGRCGAPVEVGALFCGRCGVDVTVAQDDDATVAMTTGGTPVSSGDSGVTLRTRLREATLGEYEILDELGRGGMATVFRAHDISLDRKVAIKVMAPHLLEGEGMAERFKLEARTAAQLSHPHIIPIYAVKESASTLFFVMKYVDGRALDEIIARTGQLPIAMVKDILIKVGSALGYAHRRGVVHRDVKPGNIMIDEEGIPIVADFGIAKLMSGATGLTVTGTTIGTPSYMSPEQCEAKEVTGASDQYSLGIVAFQMLTGRLPYEGDSAVTVMYKHCHEELPPLADYRPDCPPDLVDTVARMVAKDPAERWPSMQAAIQKLSVSSSSEAYLDPIRKELVKAAKEGDFERLAELSTGGRAAADSTPAEDATELLSAEGGGGRRLRSVAAVVLLLGAAGSVAVLQPWSSGESPAVDARAGTGPDGGGGLDDGEAGREGIPREAQLSGEVDSAATGAPTEPDTGLPAAGEAAAGGVGNTPQGGDPPEGGATTPAARIVVADVRVSGPTALAVGETAAFAATALDQGGDRIPESTVESCETLGWSECGVRWTSENPDVLSVSSDGAATALSTGTATLAATIGTEVGRWLVDVSVPTATAVRVSPASLRMMVGARERVQATGVDPAGAEVGGQPPRWTSSDSSVARVNPGGQVEGVRPGRASLLASLDGASASIEVVVFEAAETGVPRVVAAFADALAREDLAAAKLLFPAMTEEAEQRFNDLFAAVRMREVRLDIEAMTPSGETVAAVLRGVYLLEDPRAGSQELDVVLDAAFALSPGGEWQITRWDQLDGD